MADIVASSEKLTEEDARQRIVRVVQMVVDEEITLEVATKSIATMSELAGHPPAWGFAFRDHPALLVQDH
jgi:hypothetical protein